MAIPSKGRGVRGIQMTGQIGCVVEWGKNSLSVSKTEEKNYVEPVCLKQMHWYFNSSSL